MVSKEKPTLDCEASHQLALAAIDHELAADEDATEHRIPPVGPGKLDVVVDRSHGPVGRADFVEVDSVGIGEVQPRPAKEKSELEAAVEASYGITNCPEPKLTDRAASIATETRLQRNTQLAGNAELIGYEKERIAEVKRGERETDAVRSGRPFEALRLGGLEGDRIRRDGRLECMPGGRDERTGGQYEKSQRPRPRSEHPWMIAPRPDLRKCAGTEGAGLSREPEAALLSARRLIAVVRERGGLRCAPSSRSEDRERRRRRRRG